MFNKRSSLSLSLSLLSLRLSFPPTSSALKSAFRNPSLLKNKIVFNTGSSCIDTVPYVCGVARRTSAWFNMKVVRREKSWRDMSEDAELRAADVSLLLEDMVVEGQTWTERRAY